MTLHTSPARRCACALVVPAVLLGISACDHPTPAEPSSPNAPAPRLDRPQPPPPPTSGTVEVTVKERGTTYAGVVVTLVNGVRGPFREMGLLSSVLKEETDSKGVATFADVPFGGYCVRVDGIRTVDEATAYGNWVVPDERGIENANADLGSGILVPEGNKLVTVPTTESAYLDHCVHATSPAVVLSEQSPTAKVTIGNAGHGSQGIRFLDLEGNPVATSGWMVVGDPVDPLVLPWAGDFQDLPGARPGTTPGILLSVLAAGGGSGTFQGLPPGVEVAMEALAGPPIGRTMGGPQIQDQTDEVEEIVLTASRRFTTPPAGGVVDAGDAPMDPLVCVLQEKPAAAGTSNGIDILGTVSDGTRATTPPDDPDAVDPELVAVPAVGIWFDFTGAGSEQLHARLQGATGGVTNLVFDWAFDGESCLAGTLGGPAAAVGVGVRLFCRENEDGSVQATFSIDDLPEGTTTVEYAFKDFPDPTRTPGGDSVISDAFSLIEVAGGDASCTDSNDPPFSMIT